MVSVPLSKDVKMSEITGTKSLPLHPKVLKRVSTENFDVSKFVQVASAEASPIIEKEDRESSTDGNNTLNCK